MVDHSTNSKPTSLSFSAHSTVMSPVPQQQQQQQQQQDGSFKASDNMPPNATSV
jgi:hypothetical protein